MEPRCHTERDLVGKRRRTCGEIPVRCLRWLLTRLDFLIMECMLSLEILSMNVSSSPFLYFTTVDSRGRVEFTGRTRRGCGVFFVVFGGFFLYRGLSCVCTR